MGYEVHIERIDESNKITLREWLDFIEAQPDFQLVDQLTLKNPFSGKEIVLNVET